MSRHALRVDFDGRFPVREGLRVDHTLMHSRRQYQAEGFEGQRGAIVVSKVGSDSGKDEVERLTRLLNERQSLDQGSEVGRRGISAGSG